MVILKTPWKGESKDSKKLLTHATHFLPYPKLPLSSKMSKNRKTLNMDMSYAVGKPMKRRFQKIQNFSHIPSTSCPSKKFSLSQNDPKLSWASIFQAFPYWWNGGGGGRWGSPSTSKNLLIPHPHPPPGKNPPSRLPSLYKIFIPPTKGQSLPP